MKIVIEKHTDGTVYVYKNSKKHYKRIKDQIPGRLITVEELNEECNLDAYDGPCAIVINGKVRSHK